MAQQAVFAVLERGGSIAVDEAKYLLGVSEKVESAKKQLMRMQAFLKDLDDKMLKGGDMEKNLVSDIREVAYEVEDIIDAANILQRQSDPKISITGAMCKYTCLPVYLSRLHNLGARIDSVEARTETIFKEFDKLKLAATAIAEVPQGFIIEDHAIQRWRAVHPHFTEQVNVVGFDEQIEQIKDDLLDEGNKHLSLTVVSIIGPGGAGKSTMAAKVYGLDAVKRHFDIHDWITVSQRIVPRDLLIEMANRVVPRSLLDEMIKHTMRVEEAKKLEEMTLQQVKKLLHDWLLSKKYLIVLDDIWSADAWDMIRDAFPDGKNGSRFILTTRNEAVAKHPDARTKLYTPKLLNEEESTKLLLRTAIPEYILDGSSDSPGALPQNLNALKELGKDLAAKCRGLPLAVVVLAGHLSRNLNVEEWKRLTSGMDWHALITGDRIIGAILDLSYYDMPSRLRSCFMYTTAFPEDLQINVGDLASLWIAEGFIPLVRNQTQEEVALKYVAELVQRCMIQVAERASSGRITVVKVHVILRDWGIGRAQREGFMKDCYTAEDIERAYTEESVKPYRVVLHGKRKMEAGISLRQQPRTLLDFTVSFKLQVAMRHLRVLYIYLNGYGVHLPSEIGQMRYLRHLGLGGTSTRYTIPSSIGNLLSLETMHITGNTVQISEIPHSLWMIATLRHVHVCAFCPSVPQINILPSRKRFIVSRAGDMLEATKEQVSKNKNPNFSCYYAMMSREGTRMEVVGRLRQGQQYLPSNLPDLKEMQELYIRCANLLNDDRMMLELGGLMHLTWLEIGEQSYTGSVMVFPSGSFQSLEGLVLYDLDEVEDWKIDTGSMKRLLKLTLYRCQKLRCLPEGLSSLPRLNTLRLMVMPQDCYQQGTVVQDLKKNGCGVFIMSDEKHIRVYS
ncbi:unnamed protein product [Urochloa decumbens]|uniref:Uncharacterized protein n=1 Tax=Urochloa decumbens TaxID=240449 RepID=A0ABC9DVR1_9POAL